ncbi:hypothetical protein [Burkholderia gladioli]|uniref:hypothetical protein n=1 Tax=Burkholderia gladioli TaxID=28095 RepID=UPI001641C082|nr:hypothetical protein [Burkholderia gladioli]
MTKAIDRETIAHELEQATEALYQACALFGAIERLVAHGDEDVVDLIGLCKLGSTKLGLHAQRASDLADEVRNG